MATTNGNGNGNGDYFEKPWYKSRKYMAFLITQIVLAGVTGVTLFTQKIGWELASFMFGVIVVMGWTTTMFMGKQAECDMFMRGMTSLGKAPEKYASRVPDLAKAKEEPVAPDSPPTT
jgi:hypothetical protein